MRRLRSQPQPWSQSADRGRSTGRAGSISSPLLEEALGQGTQFNICDLNGFWVCPARLRKRGIAIRLPATCPTWRARRCAEAIVASCSYVMRLRINAGGRLEALEFLPGLGVNSLEIALQRSVERHVTRSRQGTRPDREPLFVLTRRSSRCGRPPRPRNCPCGFRQRADTSTMSPRHVADQLCRSP